MFCAALKKRMAVTAPGEAVWNLTPISTEFGSLAAPLAGVAAGAEQTDA
jgi:hypothetical protein